MENQLEFRVRNLFMLLLVFCNLHSSAQFLQDVGGKPYVSKTQNATEGSPFLFQKWTKATVITTKKETFADMMINVDLVQNLPVFFRDETIYSFSGDISEFTVEEDGKRVKFKKGKLIDGDLPNTFFEVIDDSIGLLKKYNKQLVEVPNYGAGGGTYRYSESEAYYAKIDDKIKKINLTKANAEKVFSKQWKAIEPYLQTNEKAAQTETGWRKMTDLYKRPQ